MSVLRGLSKVSHSRGHLSRPGSKLLQTRSPWSIPRSFCQSLVSSQILHSDSGEESEDSQWTLGIPETDDGYMVLRCLLLQSARLSTRWDHVKRTKDLTLLSRVNESGDIQSPRVDPRQDRRIVSKHVQTSIKVTNGGPLKR